MRRITAPILLVIISISILLVTRVFAQNSQEIRWQEVPLQSGEVAEIAIAPSDPNVMYAGFEVNSHSLYKSEDAGRTWRRIDGGGDHAKDVAVSPRDPNRVYLAMSESLETTDRTFTSTARSLYGGPPGFTRETQVILSTGVPAGGSSVSFSSVEVFEGDDNIIYAARKGGSMGPFGRGVAPKIYKTVDRGQTWNDVEPKLSRVNVLAVHPSNPNLILIGSDGIYMSQDQGRTLNKLVDLPNTISIEFQISDPNVIYAASDSKVLRSNNSGASWSDITDGLSDVHRVRVSRSNPNVLYASTFNGVFRSDDYGGTWRDISGNLKAKNIQIVEIHPQNPDIAFVGHSSLWSSVRSEDRYRTGLLAHQGIFKTEDGGRTWVRSDNGIKEYMFEEVAVNSNKPYEAWVLSPASRGGYKTEDGGSNFRLSQTPTFHYPMRVKYSLQDPDKVFATGWQNGAPFSYSDNGGVNWNFVSEDSFFDGLNRGKDLRTNQARAIHLHGLAVDPKNDQTIFVGSVDDAQNPVGFLKGAHIFKSEDGGKSWEEADSGFPHESETAIHDITINPQNTNIIYASTTRHEAKQGIGVYKSVDGGEGWQEASNGLSGESLSVNALLINPQNTNELLIATFGGLYKSENGGDSWTRTSSANSFDAEYVADDVQTVYASTNQGVLRSFDFGDNWLPFGTGLASGPGHGIGVDKTGQVVYAAVGSHDPSAKSGRFYVARLADTPAKDPVSEFGGNPYSFGPFGPGGFEPLTSSERQNFLIILAGVVVVFVVLPISTILIVQFIRKKKGGVMIG